MIWDDASWEALSAALRKLPAPQPPDGLLQRILASHAAGVRVTPLVSERSRVARHTLRYAAAASALVAGLWLGSKALESTAARRQGEWPPAWVVGGAPFAPSAAFGQERAPRILSPRYPLITEIEPSRVHAGRWTYQESSTAEGVYTTSQRSRTLVIVTGAWGRQAAWILTGSETRDTVLVDRATLRPLRYVRPLRRGYLIQQFAPDSMTELLSLARPPDESERTLRGAAKLPASGGPLLVSWSPHSLELLVRALPLDQSWRGSVYSVNWITMTASLAAFTPLDLRVTGTEWVVVPAGRFDCWRLEARQADERATLWVSRDQGWLVLRRHRWSDGSGKWRTESLNETRLLAVDTLPTPPAP
jgi:hypothetical protein